MPALFKRLIIWKLLVFSAIYGHSPVIFASPLTKAQMEQQAHLLIWDQGVQKGLWDAQDRVVDLTKGCQFPRPKISDADSLIARAFPRNLLESESLLSLIDLDQENLSSSVITSHSGSQQKLVILFPEFHVSSKATSEGLQLHRNLLKDKMLIFEKALKKNWKVLNSIEGLAELWRYDVNHKLEESQRALEFESIMQSNEVVNIEDLADLFFGRVQSFYNENAFEFLKHFISDSLYFKQKKGVVGERAWQQIVKDFNYQHPQKAEVINIQEIKKYFEQISSFTNADLRNEVLKSCDDRSVVMANNTLKNMQKSKNLAVVTLGAQHVHGFVERLKEEDVSFIVFSPNL